MRFGRRCVADGVGGVVGLEGGGVVGVLHHPGGDAQGLALAEPGLAGEAIGLGELVPERTIAPEVRCDRGERLAGADLVAAGGGALGVGVDRAEGLFRAAPHDRRCDIGEGVVLVGLDLGSLGYGAVIVEQAGLAAVRVVACIGHFLAAEPAPFAAGLPQVDCQHCLRP